MFFFLIGMPGAGKTYWGKVVAEAFGYPFIDLDQYIETEQSKTISGIFEQLGEDAFRELEATSLARIIADNENAIIACGGGTPCFYDNLLKMKSTGKVIYLKTSISHLLQNLEHELIKRPLLITGDPQAVLESLLNHRKYFYDQADFILHTENISLPTFGEIIPSCINRP